MDKVIRESIALARFQIISPILAEPKRAQNNYFREQAGNTSLRDMEPDGSVFPP